MTIETLFDLSHTLAAGYLRRFSYPWEALEGLQTELRRLGETLGADYRQIGPEVWVHETATVAPTAYIGGPCIIGAGTEVRHCAFIRGSALIGSGCVVGNSVEIKNAILFDKVQVPHFNYVGDSILGYLAHMGAGAVTSNVRSDKCPVVIHGETEIPTGRKKVGAMVGDRAEIGCNSVLNPGSVIGKDAIVYPTSCVRGVVPAGHIHKNDGTVVERK
jgi:NDP-sugar pyrophosphorylase family protein